MNIENILRECSSVAIWGTGECSIAAKRILNRFDINVEFYLDGNESKWGSTHEGARVLSYAECPKDKIIVIGSSFAKEISTTLIGHSGKIIDLSIAIDFDRFKNTFDTQNTFKISEARAVGRYFLSGEDLDCYLACVEYRESNRASILRPSRFSHYFHPAVLPPKEGGNYLDAGAWEGDTVGEVLAFNSTAEIIAFEPDRKNFNTLLRNLEMRTFGAGSNNVIPVPAGLWSDERILRFCASGDSVHTMQARVLGDHLFNSDLAYTEIKTTTIDKYLGSSNRCDFIKMDIEGAEIEALRGASQTLIDLQPRLAISAYHEPNHLWEIIKFINNINPKYRFFFGHHSSCMYESVVYAKADIYQ